MGFAGTSRRYGSKPPTKLQRMARAVNFVTSCRPERLATLTAQEVANFSGVEIAKCEQMLATARTRRVG